ncbi:hypothetical protein [Brasilonema sp. UFV-L1]|uniref:hypothetical protein n=1 Tax=Brasilonema sp. UFV-L1 TaxID=2234130 RepID=UPI0030DB21DC
MVQVDKASVTNRAGTCDSSLSLPNMGFSLLLTSFGDKIPFVEQLPFLQDILQLISH